MVTKKMGREKLWIREVWASNFHKEIFLLDQCLNRFKILSIDTEFPGCIRTTPSGSMEEQIYKDFRSNLTQTKLIQLGLTALDESGKVGGSWEFNFSDFDSKFDDHNHVSISFLERNGIDFDKLKNEGIPLIAFTMYFVRVLRRNRISRWITFHGLYDIGYLLKAMGYAELPESMEEFGWMVATVVGTVRDLKHMARFCDGLENGRLGLERLSELVGEERYGMKHHAGSDSLLSACVHTKMIELYGLESSVCDGYLYGISNRFQCKCMANYKTIMFGQILSSIPIS